MSSWNNAEIELKDYLHGWNIIKFEIKFNDIALYDIFKTDKRSKMLSWYIFLH